ncbi:MAG: energy transducer TonB [Candidatus Omnitrophica bacterium]|nr:energy transducer TonB [Candidatus Omnitrophota bacterium]MBU4479590.1 energy transducer TonB [Candidatus Omnitrophota bacterium]MCG2703724.1 energy transducer TonB [Candidatus Omnitrophota bacterium]
MVEKNIFVIALSCSILWHILSVQIVTVVWPTYSKRPSFAAVNFLGPMVETVDVTAEHFMPQEQEETAGALVAPKDTALENAQPAVPLAEKMPLPLGQLSPRSSPEPELGVASGKGFLVAEVVGTHVKRPVLFKPNLPDYPQWARNLGSDFEIQLKFLILPDGTVGTVEKVTSSGYPELDEIGVRYVRKWKFIALADDAAQQEQWGLIKLFFKLQ